MSIRIPYARQWIDDDDVAAVSAALRSSHLTQGPILDAFEQELAEKLGAQHAVVCSSGTSALHLAYHVLDVRSDTTVVTSPVTFLADANAAVMCGANVAFADVDPNTGNVTSDTIEAAIASISGRVGAIVPVHLGGLPCDMPAIRHVADKVGAAVIEDACHAPLAVYHDDGTIEGEATVGVCAHSQAAVFSFHAIKHIAMGEGGAVVTNDGNLAAKLRRLRSHGTTRDRAKWTNAPDAPAPWYYEMPVLGWNYRASEMQCALGRSQLRRLEAGIERRRNIACRYHELLADVPNVRLPRLPTHPRGHVWHLFAPAFDFQAIGMSRGAFMTALSDRGIGTQVHYIPIYRQPYYSKYGLNEYPGAERYYRDTLSIPMHPGMSDNEVTTVAGAIRELCAA